MSSDGQVTAEQAIEHAYPLDCEDGSLGGITMSMVLQRFPHHKVKEVLAHWVSKLGPGGRLRLSVPDLEQIAKRYLAGEPIDVQGYAMGSQLGDFDQNRSVFDEELLTELLIGLGMERIRKFADAELQVNLECYKPSGEYRSCVGTVAVLSAPRFGPTLHARVAGLAFSAVGVPYVPAMGAYWHQVLCETMEKAIGDDHPYTQQPVEFLVTSDYDSVFSAADVLELYRLTKACEGADAICAVQTQRDGEQSLFSMPRVDGTPRSKAYAVEFDRHLTPIRTGHFGLTIFRAETLRRLPHPWMVPTPSPEGRWGKNRVDADIDFWHRFAKDGRQLFLANRVVIGHQEECIAWPGEDFKPVRQTVNDYLTNGMPLEARRAIV